MDAQTDNSTATVDDRRHRIRELKARKLENQLALEVAQQEQALTALSYAGMSAPVRVARQRARRESAEAMEDTGLFNPDVVTPSDYMGEPGYSGYGGAVGQAGWLSTRSDREDGRNRPVFATENELGMIRGAARLLATYNPNAVGILGHLKNYAVGEGCVYRFSMFDSKSDQTLAKACQKVVDRFIEDNAFVGDYDSELFGRSCRDGEYFFGLWHQGHGRVEGRAIEPEQITEPSTPRDIEEWLDQTAGLDSWWGGVHSDADDTESIHGVYAQWSNNSQDWDYLPAGRKPCSPPSGNNAWVEHFKTDNVDRKIKRGLSDFFCAGMLDKARKLLRNMGDGASVQSAIAWIVETAAGTLPTTVQSLTLNQSAGQYQQSIQQGTRVNQIGKYDPATIVYTANGTVYKPAPMGSTNAPNFVVVYEAMMRSLAVRWQMPEHFVTGSAANNDYASILEAGSPSEKAMRRRQAGIAGSHARIMWKVYHGIKKHNIK